MDRFKDRSDAGRYLARFLQHYSERDDVVILALPRGGVPVGFEISRALHAPLDIFLVRKLGFPGHEEYAIGAIASGGVRVLNPHARNVGFLSQEMIDRVTAREQVELERRERLYRGDRPAPNYSGQIGILVDDGLATGSTMRAAVLALRQHDPKKIVVAVPVAAVDSCEMLQADADEVVCAMTPEPFYAVGQWYEQFGQTTDEEVQDLLEQAHALEAKDNHV